MFINVSLSPNSCNHWLCFFIPLAVFFLFTHCVLCFSSLFSSIFTCKCRVFALCFSFRQCYFFPQSMGTELSRFLCACKRVYFHDLSHFAVGDKTWDQLWSERQMPGSVRAVRKLLTVFFCGVCSLWNFKRVIDSSFLCVRVIMCLLVFYVLKTFVFFCCCCCYCWSEAN